jgi:hypothetical protein
LDHFDDLPLIAVLSIFISAEKAFRVLESDYTAAQQQSCDKTQGGGTHGRAKPHDFTDCIVVACSSGDGRSRSGA